jgi:uncharacterized damage-inducible protein DinB
VKPRQPKTNNELSRAAVRAFAANERMNQLLLRELDPAAWTARPPGKVRTVAQIFTHMHNVRTKWIRLSAPHLKFPRQLARAHGTPAQVRAALAESAALCTEMLAEALGPKDRAPARVTHFLRDGWAKPWPVGANGSGGIEMLAYMLTHEAHHRGQVCLLAHQLGFKLPGRVTSALWNWERSWTMKKRPARFSLEHRKPGTALD